MKESKSTHPRILLLRKEWKPKTINKHLQPIQYKYWKKEAVYQPFFHKAAGWWDRFFLCMQIPWLRSCYGYFPNLSCLWNIFVDLKSSPLIWIDCKMVAAASTGKCEPEKPRTYLTLEYLLPGWMSKSIRSGEGLPPSKKCNTFWKLRLPNLVLHTTSQHPTPNLSESPCPTDGFGKAQSEWGIFLIRVYPC